MSFLGGLIIGVVLGWFISVMANWFVQRKEEAHLLKRLETAETETRQLRVRLANTNHMYEKVTAAETEMKRLQGRVAENNLLQEKLEAAEAEIGHLRTQLADDEKQFERLAAAETEIADLRSELAEMHALRSKLTTAELTIDQLQVKLAKISRRAGQKQDHLEMIHGIGSVFAGRLNRAGVYTFAELARLTPDRVKEIVAAKEWQKVDPMSWISQAKDFANIQNEIQ